MKVQVSDETSFFSCITFRILTFIFTFTFLDYSTFLQGGKTKTSFVGNLRKMRSIYLRVQQYTKALLILSL